MRTWLLLAALVFASGACDDTKKAPSAATASAQATSSATEASTTPTVASAPAPDGIDAHNLGIVKVAARLEKEGDTAKLAGASRRLVEIAKEMASGAFRKSWRSELEKANKRAGLAPTAELLDLQVQLVENERLARIYEAMKHVVGAPVLAHCWNVAEDKKKPKKRRLMALGVLEKVADKHSDTDAQRFKKIVDALGRPAPPAPPADGNIVANATEVIGRLKRGLAGCRLDNAPKFSGTIKFDLTVDHDGSVRKAESDLSEPRTMLECMTFLLRLAEFDPPKGGSALVSFPITFVSQP